MVNARPYPLTAPHSLTFFRYVRAIALVIGGVGLGMFSVVIPFFQLFLPFVLPLVGVVMALNELK